MLYFTVPLNVLIIAIVSAANLKSYLQIYLRYFELYMCYNKVMQKKQSFCFEEIHIIERGMSITHHLT